MVSIMAIHMAQVFLFGAFKYPRELTWISGCVLLLLTLGMAFTGQIMRFDQDAYWGLGIGAAIMGRMPAHRTQPRASYFWAARSLPVKPCRGFSRCMSLSFPDC